MSAIGSVADEGPAGEPGEGGALLARVSGWLALLEDALNIVAAATIFVIMIGTTAYIGFRLSGAPIAGYLDVSQLAIAVFAFLGAAYAQRMGAHIRMEIVIGAIKGRGRWLAEAVGSMLSLLMILVLIRYSWDFFLNAYLIGDSTVDFEIPTWPAKILVPIAFSVWALRMAIETIGYFRLFLHPSAVPVAVPLTLSAAEEARKEIKESGADRDDFEGEDRA